MLLSSSQLEVAVAGFFSASLWHFPGPFGCGWDRDSDTGGDGGGRSPQGPHPLTAFPALFPDATAAAGRARGKRARAAAPAPCLGVGGQLSTDWTRGCQSEPDPAPGGRYDNATLTGRRGGRGGLRGRGAGAASEPR